MTILKAILSFFIPIAIFAEFLTENGVIVLNDGNFEEAIASFPNGLLVEMYAPWCGHCKQLAPEYEKAAAALAEMGYSIAKVDATENTEISSFFEIHGFPTIKYIIGGMSTDYNGERKAEDIVNYVIRKNGPPAILLDSEAAINSFLSKSDVVVIGFFSDESNPAVKKFTDAANIKDEFFFGIVTSSELMATTESVPNSIQIIKTFDERKSVFFVDEETTVDDIIIFVDAYSVPLIMKYSPETAKQIFSGSIELLALFFSDDLEGELLEIAKESAEKYRGMMLHAHIGPNEPRISEYFGINDEDYPTLVIAEMKQVVKKYLIGNTPLTKENIFAFEEHFFAGKLIPHLKSEEPTDSDLYNDVKIVKGKSFKPVVVDNDDNVFVMFHAPWCSHCQALAPTWEKLGEAAKKMDGVIIAKMDGTANEVDFPGVEYDMFPTLIFFPSGEKESPIVFDGERDLDGLIEFIETNSRHLNRKDEL